MRPGARFVFLVVATAATSATDVRADPRFGPNDLPSLFEIGKNIDRNVVRYGIHLDKDCVPIGEEPLFGQRRPVLGRENLAGQALEDVLHDCVLLRSAED